MNGYWGKILVVDAESGDSAVEPIPNNFPAYFLGGFGFGARILFDEVSNVDALSPENPLIACPGLLTATGVPTASKTAFVSKSPLTGTFGRSVVGARFGVSLKRSGYDILVVKNKAEKPSVLVIEDENVYLEPTNTWGLKVREAREKLKEKYGKDFSTAIIGIAGERLSKIACIDCDERQAGRGGLGAVMGSKNIKALLAKGTKKMEVYNEERLRELNKIWRERIAKHPATPIDVNYGTAEFYDWMNRERGMIPSRNWRYSYFKKIYDSLEGDEKSHLDPYYWVPKYVKRNSACPACNKPCGKWLVVEGGKYSCTVDGVDYETLYSFGTNLEIDDIEAVAKANELCDEYGIDTISAGLVISWAIEAMEKGLIKEEDFELKLRFGEPDSVLKAIKLIATKEGKVGSILGDGVKRAVEKVGKGEEFAIHIKGMELPGYDVRGSKGLALAFAVSYRGACHLTSTAYGAELVGKWWTFDNVDRFSTENKAFEIKVHEDLMAVYDALGVCKFSRHMFYAEGFLELIHAVTGMKMDVWDLMAVGERINNLARAFNVREGFGRKDDTLPPRVLKEAIPSGPSEGGIILENELEVMLERYYEARGWDSEGRPTRTLLHILGMDEIADALYGDKN